MDITTFAAAFGSIKTATEVAKLFMASDFSLEKAEAKLKMAEIVEALADAKMQMTVVQEQMRELEAQLQRKGQLQWRDPAYWLEDGSSLDGPYCQKCQDTDGKLVRLQDAGDGLLACRACQCAYKTTERRRRDADDATRFAAARRSGRL